MSVQIRGFREDDLDAVFQLRERTFENLTRERELVRWRWQFDCNPFRRKEVPSTWVLEEAGRIVGNFGMIPYDCRIEDQVHLALDGIDLCVHPDYRGRGLAHLLADAFMDAELSAYPFVSAPTGATTHLLVSRGGTLVGASPESITWVCRSGAPDRGRGEVQVREVARFGEEWDRFWSSLAPSYRLIIVRNSAYLNWRYADYPFEACRLHVSTDASGAITGGVVLQEDQALSRLYLLELLIRPGDQASAQALVAKARNLLVETGLSLLAFVTREAWLHPVLREAGFEEPNESIPTYVGKLNLAGYDNVKVADWFVSLGDGDALFSVGG